MPKRKVPEEKRNYWKKRIRRALYNIPERWRKFEQAGLQSLS